MIEIIDGIIDQHKYNASKYKIMWILKEGNVSEGDKAKNVAINLCTGFSSEHHRENALSIPTFRKMIYATYGILNPETEWSDVPFANEDAYEAILQVAYININKYPGGSVSNSDEIKKIYTKNKQVLLKQIKECKPDIIIFGGTWSYFETEDLVSIGWDISKCKTKYVDEAHIGTTTTYFTVSPTKLCINAYHPAYPRVADKAYWSEIKTAVKKWEQEKGN
jgi:hypothetical protein